MCGSTNNTIRPKLPISYLEFRYMSASCAKKKNFKRPSGEDFLFLSPQRMDRKWFNFSLPFALTEWRYLTRTRLRWGFFVSAKMQNASYMSKTEVIESDCEFNRLLNSARVTARPRVPFCQAYYSSRPTMATL